MHLVYSQGKEVTPENDGIELELDECYMHRLYRPHTVKTFKKKFGIPQTKYFLFDLTTQKFVRNQQLFMVRSYFIMPGSGICFCFGDYL